MVVHTHDGQKYLYNPEAAFGHGKVQKPLAIAHTPIPLDGAEGEDAGGDAAVPDIVPEQGDDCSWAEWGQFTSCEPIGECRPSACIELVII